MNHPITQKKKSIQNKEFFECADHNSEQFKFWIWKNLKLKSTFIFCENLAQLDIHIS